MSATHSFSRSAGSHDSNEDVHHPYVPENALASSPREEPEYRQPASDLHPFGEDYSDLVGNQRSVVMPDEHVFGDFGPHEGFTPNPFGGRPVFEEDATHEEEDRHSQHSRGSTGSAKRRPSDPFATAEGIQQEHIAFQRQSSVKQPSEPSPSHASATQAKPVKRRQSVALALSKPKDKDKRNSADAGPPIEVVPTIPIDNGVQAHEEGTTEDQRVAEGMAEALFVPNMKREQYIPVRVARDKIKQVLSEMAQMKMMHLAAIDTMEKQHQFLKAQLESACAAYARKLTTDYNNRVKALNQEFDRRLKAGGVRPPSPDKTELKKLQQQLERVQGDWHHMSEQLDTVTEERDEALRQTENLQFQIKAMEEKINVLLAQQQQSRRRSSAAGGGATDAAALEEWKARLATKEQENDELRGKIDKYEHAVGHLEKQLAEASNGVSNGSDADSAHHTDEDLRAENKDLRSEVERLRDEVATLQGLVAQHDTFTA